MTTAVGTCNLACWGEEVEMYRLRFQWDVGWTEVSYISVSEIQEEVGVKIAAAILAGWKSITITVLEVINEEVTEDGRA